MMFARFRESITQNIVAPSRIDAGHLRAALWPQGRSPGAVRHAAAVIAARVQLVAAMFALLVPFASIIDLLVFDSPTARYLVVLRLFSAAAFVVLAWPRKLSDAVPYWQAMLMLLVLLLIPPLFHLLSADLLREANHTEMQQLMGRLYGYLPTVVLGGLAIFPLTAVETLIMALPVVATAGIGFLLQGMPFSIIDQGGSLWFMFIMLGVAIFSGMSQCHYMATLVHRASHDPLTGAYTRQSGEEALDLLFRLGEMAGKPLSLAFVDIDHFKAINDGYGHDAGDRALQQFCASLARGLRRSDFVVRWGGEEFVLVLPDTPPENLLGLFQRLREQGFGQRPDGNPLTASIGVACNAEAGVTGWSGLVTRADQRMYLAKSGGRDCLALSESRLVPLAPEMAEQAA